MGLRAWGSAVSLGVSILVAAPAAQAPRPKPHAAAPRPQAPSPKPQPSPPAAKARPRPQARSPKPQALSQQLTRIFDAPALERSYWSVLVRSLDNGRTIFSRNAGKLMMPASNMKVVTLAAAAERLGWDYRFETRIVATAPVVNGLLGGDLVVVGTGDPSMNARHDRADKLLEDVAWQLREAGIHAIQGDVVADDRLFTDPEIGGGWSWDYLQFGYAAPVNALAYAENLITITVHPSAAADEPARIEVSPTTTDVTLMNRATTTAAGTEQTIDLARERGSTTLDVIGGIPLGAEAVRRTAAVQDPGLSFARALRDALVRHGIEVRGQALEPPRTPSNLLEPLEPSGTHVVARIVSPPLWEIATVLMKISQNLYAEMLFRTIGGGTVEGGRKVVTELLASWTIAPEQFVLADGSGLSRYDFVTAEMLVTILERMYGDPRHRDRFMATLPIAGLDGTLQRRMRGTRAQENARAKTGSIANARTLSGYVTTASGETLAFAILANNFTLRGAAIDEITDRAVDAMARSGGRSTPRRPSP